MNKYVLSAFATLAVCMAPSLAQACSFNPDFENSFSLPHWAAWEYPSQSQAVAVEDARSEEVQLLRVTTDMAEGFSDFKMAVDQNHSIQTLRYYLNTGTKSEFTVDQVRAGVVIAKASGKDVLKLKGEKFDAQHGGPVTLIYLTNGITNSYANFEMELARTGDHWTVRINDQAGHHDITTLFFKGKKLFGKWIGIEKIIAK